MGNLCSSCFGSEEKGRVLTPTIEDRRRLQQEAAERRLKENATRGIQNPGKVARQQKRLDDMERQEREMAQQGQGGPTLRWQAN